MREKKWTQGGGEALADVPSQGEEKGTVSNSLLSHSRDSSTVEKCTPSVLKNEVVLDSDMVSKA